MKKCLEILLVCFIGLGLSASVTKSARAVNQVNDHMSVVCVGNPDDGEIAEVDNNNALITAKKTVTAARIGGDGSITGWMSDSILYGFSVTAPSATDYIHIYNHTSATGNPVFDIMVGTNNSTVFIPLGYGITFSTDIYIDATDAEVRTTLLYDLN